MTTFEENTTITFNWVIQQMLGIVAPLYEKAGHACHVTSGCDRTHSVKSLHYQNRALDFRTKHLPPAIKGPLVADIRAALIGLGYDILLENPGTSNEHLHIEWDPHERVHS